MAKATKWLNTILDYMKKVKSSISIESFRSTFMLNGEWSCDHENDVNVHRKKLTAKVILDHHKSP